MITTYMKAAFRNLWMHKGYTAINIAGLSIGLASSFIIILYSLNELSVDRHNEKLDNIYLATTEQPDLKWTQPSTPYLLGPTLKDEYPEVQQFARFMRGNCPVKYKDKSFDRAYCLSADLSIFQILTLPLESGSVEGLAQARDFAVISHETAQRIFGDANPVGEVITINWIGESYSLKIAAVMKDMPRTTTLRAEIIVPLSIGEKWLSALWGKMEKNPLDSWNLQFMPAYVLLSPSVTPEQIESKMAAFTKSHSDPIRKVQYHLFPLKDLYFNSSGFVNNVFPSGDITNVYVYSTIGILILLIACINFVILNTGRASVRTKEIAVRKVVGASRFDLMKQIMMESVMVSVLSLPVAIFLVELFLPSLSQLLGKRIPGTFLHELNHIFLFSGITILAGILSGSYVSFYLSGLRPMEILRNTLGTGASKATLRRIMIAVQMVIFIGLITASITITKQVRYFHSKDMGYDKADLVVLSARNLSTIMSGVSTKFDAVKAELMTHPAILGVSGAATLPGTEGGSFSALPDKSDPSRKIRYQVLSVDREFIETMKMQMVSGKSFAEATPEESEHAMILNEAALKAFGIKDPSQEKIQDARILGIVRDFNVRSLREPIAPVVLRCDTKYLGEIAIRVRHDADLPQTIAFIQKTSTSFNNGQPMDHQFFDDRLDDMYANDYRFARMIGYFTALAIFIACLGLFGMSIFVIQTRVKEIGIRKVMGASAGTIFFLVSREFIALILISTIIAIPITVYVLDGWLQNYAYRVSVDGVVVILSLLAAVCIVLVTIGYQAVKAARANPVEALRYE